MRQAVVRIPLKVAMGETAALFYDKIESARFVGLVGPSRDSFQSIWRIVFKDRNSLSEGPPNLHGIAKVEILAREGDEFVLYLERKLSDYDPLSRIRHLMPWEVNGQDLRVNIIGTDEEIQRWMKELEENHIPFKVDSMGVASFVPPNPLAELTKKQADIFLEAYKRGYYKIPRNTSLKEIADAFTMDESTVAEHLRKAESALLTRAVTDAHLFSQTMSVSK